jgi:hypothetical protein
MATEKIPIELLVSKLTSIPGGISIYDSAGTSTKTKTPSLVSELQSKGIQFVSKGDMEEQGIHVTSTSNKGIQIQFVYPKMQQSLVSFEGTIPAHTLIFTNPSEEPTKHRQELTLEVFRTIEDIKLTNSEPTTLSVRRISDKAPIEISRLGHFISLYKDQPILRSFPPDDLRLFLPPVHIPSQHLGDCAADTVQTALFFADGFQEEFAELANTLYTKYIRTEPLVLFGVDNPKLIEEIRRTYALPTSLSKEENDVVAVFANMIRRYILVRLLDFGTEEEIQSLDIPPTQCVLPGAVPSMGKVQGRRRSINVLAGSTIARKISRVFEPSSMISSKLKLKPTEIHLQMEHDFFCLLFKVLKQKSMHSLIWKRAIPIPFDIEKIRALLFPLIQSQKNTGASLEGGGHSISLFRFQDIWYLQDDNIGIAKPLLQFDIEHFLTKKGEFFISSYQQLQNKSDLLEQGFFTEKELQEGNGRVYVYYGYRYSTTGYLKEKILYKDKLGYAGRYDSGEAALYLCVGEITSEEKAKSLIKCKEEEKPSLLPAETKKPQKVKDLPPELLAQMNLPTAPQKEKLAQISFPELRKNVQANLNRFNTTRKNNNTKPMNRKARTFKSYTNTKILNQFSGF